MSCSISNTFNNLSPKQVFETVETVLKPVNKVSGAVRKTIGIVADSLALANLPKLPEGVSLFSKGLGVLALPLLPFEIAKFGKNVDKALTAKDFSSFVRSTLDSLASIGSIVGKITAPYSILKAFKVISSVPAIPFLEHILLPCSILGTGLNVWDTGKEAHTFHVIQSGNRNLETNQSALAELNRLQNHGLETIGKQLAFSKQCNLATRVDALKIKLQNNENGALDEAKDFYAKMANRTSTTLTLNIFDTVLKVTSLALSIVLIATTAINPAAIGIALGSMALASFAVWAGKELFMRGDIFDPEAMSVVETIAHKVKTGVEGAFTFITNPCLGAAA